MSTSKNEEFTCRSLIFAAGSWLPSLAVGIGVPFSLERLAVFWLEPKKDAHLFGVNKTPVFMCEEEAAAKRISNNAPRIFYGIPDLGDGFKVGEHHGGEVIARPEEARREITKEDESKIRAFLKERIPSLAEGRVAYSTTCTYTNIPDGNFLIDRHPSFDEVMLVSACSGHGFKFSSVIGELIAQRILEEKTLGYDLSPFSQSRFALEKQS